MRFVVVLAVAVFCGACSVCRREAADAIDPVTVACERLSGRAEHWCQVMRANAFIRGTLVFEMSQLEAIEDGRRSPDGGFEEGAYWMLDLELRRARCILGGREPHPSKPWVHSPESIGNLALFRFDMAASVAHLRDVHFREVWYGVGGDGEVVPGALGLHAWDASQAELEAVRSWSRLPIQELGRGVAFPNPNVEAAVAMMRGGQVSATQALESLSPWSEELLPGLLAAMLRSLESRHDGEGLVGERHVQVGGYHTQAACVFDVLCLASQDLRGFKAQACTDDDSRAAEARSLALWLHLRSRGAFPARGGG